jgi:hypothetical protein
MADPIDLSMVVSSALPATFTFLYQRLDALLSRHRADPGKTRQEDVPETPEVPAVLVGELDLPLRANGDRIQARLDELEAYALGLEHYRRNPDLISSGDALLMQTLGRLRNAMEDIYLQRFTFEGEQRGQSGPYSEQHHGKVAGEVVGMEATNAIRGPATSKITTKTVETGGRVVGMRAPNIGDNR